MKKLSDYEYYRTGNGVLYLGNSLKLLPMIREKIDLLYLDPPYRFSASGGGVFNKTKRKYIKDIKENIGHEFDPVELLKTINGFSNIYIWCSRDLIYDYIGFAKKEGYIYNLLTWLKTNPVPINNNTFLPDTEYCIFLRKKGAYFNSKLPKKNYKKYILTTTGRNNHGHPTEKPEKVIVNHIKISTPAGGLVCDMYGGSGTTAVVCEKLGLRWILFDISEKYCEIIKQRAEKEYNQLKIGLKIN